MLYTVSSVGYMYNTYIYVYSGEGRFSAGCAWGRVNGYRCSTIYACADTTVSHTLSLSFFLSDYIYERLGADCLQLDASWGMSFEIYL